MPEVTVVIPCFNYGRHLEQAVASVVAQTFRDLEVIVVDDGSTDDSLAIAGALAEAHPQVKVHAQPNSGQPAYARNAGIERAEGRYVVCLDADDLLAPQAIAAEVALLEADPGLGMAYPVQQNFGASSDGPLFNAWDADALRYANRLPTTTMFRREAWEEAGGYSTNVPGYEDWDFWIACMAQGWRGALASDATFLYRVHEGGLYDDAKGRDAELKAQVVLNRPGLYAPTVVRWARAVLAGDAAARAAAGPRGFVPGFAELRRGDDVRAVAAVAFADELVAAPELLAAWGRAFSAADEVTLVIVGEAGPALQQAVAAAGIEGEGSADLLAVPERVPFVDAVYTRRPLPEDLRGLPRFDDATLAGLRTLVERRCGSPDRTNVPQPTL
jgi:glycosyltransferase involved in cell wall biosynthesis